MQKLTQQQLEKPYYEAGVSYFEYEYQKQFPEIVKKGYELAGVCEVVLKAHFNHKGEFVWKNTVGFESMLYAAMKQMPNKVIKTLRYGNHMFIVVRDPKTGGDF